MLFGGADHIQIGVPYLRAKAQDYYESLGGGIDPDLLDEGGSYQAARALADEVRSIASLILEETI